MFDRSLTQIAVIASALFAGFVLTHSPAAAADGRFVAEFADGSRLQGDEIRNWHETKVLPTLANRPLFDAANPIRWIADTTLKTIEQPRAFVEMVGGDVLPGRVEGARSGYEAPYDRNVSHLLVDVPGEWQAPGQLARPIRVGTRWLRRVVWHRRGNDRYQPGSLFYVDGRRLSFRALRWNSGSVSVLLDQETAEVAFSEIAELHLPQVDWWQSYVEQLALLAPDGKARLLQFDSIDGLRLTASFERFQAKAQGNPNDPNSWHHMLQPAWSLDAIWVPHRTIRVRRAFLPHQIPLSLLDPVRSVQTPALSGNSPWQRDRNVQFGPLECGTDGYGWGLGVHATHELEFQLPPGTRSFRTRMGLDRISGRGGCVRGIVHAGNREAPLYRSELLIGTGAIADTGMLPLPNAAAGQTRLTLIADMAHTDRPAGSDPFDIRDAFNWLEPEIELDPQSIEMSIRDHGAELLPAWDGWTIQNLGTGPLQLSNRWDITDPADPHYVTEATVRLPFLTWSRKQQLAPQHSFLLLAASRFNEGTGPSEIQVRIDGQAVAEFDVPLRNSRVDPEPLIVPLQNYAGREVALEVSQLPGGAPGKVSWRGVAFADRLPGVLPLLQDDGRLLLSQLRSTTGQAAQETDDVFTGRNAIQVKMGEVSNAELPGLRVAIRDQPRLGEFRYISFAWKKKGGQKIGLRLAADGQWGPADSGNPRLSLRYDAGVDRPIPGEAVRLEQRVPDEWVVVTRDLFQDFGSFTLTGLALDASDGEYALFDEIYLARTADDMVRGPYQRPAQPLAVFEDQRDFILRLAQGGGRATAELLDAYSGSTAVKVTPDQKIHTTLSRLGIEIRQNPGPGDYRFLRYAWKKRGGQQLLLQLSTIGRAGPQKGMAGPIFRYEAGPREPQGAGAVRISQDLPAEWTVVTRDLFADFGEFSLSGLALSPQDGEFALFDHIYLGRSLQDLDKIPSGPRPVPAAETAGQTP